MQAETGKAQGKLDSLLKLDLLLRPGSAEGGFASAGKPAIIQVLPGGKLREISHLELDQLIGQAEALLTNHGVVSGDKVIMTSPNSPELLAAILATWRLGAIATPVDFRLTEGELANVACSPAIKARVVLVFKPFIKDYAALEATLAAGDSGKITLCDLSAMHDFADKQRQAPQPASDFKNLSDPAFLILTSGTTGTPKGALHDLNSLLSNLIELGEMADFCKDLKVLLPVPISHVLGLEVIMIALLYGSTVIFSEMTVEGRCAHHIWCLCHPAARQRRFE